MKAIILLIFVLLIPCVGLTQSAASIDSLIISGKTVLQDAVNEWEESKLIQARGFFERLLQDDTYPWLVHYYVALADYRLVNFYNSKKNTELAKKYLEDGIQHLELALEQKDDFAEVHSLLSSLLGIKIGLTPWLGITLGPRSGREMGKAMELAPGNPRNYLIAGISAFFSPKIFGGGKEKARAELEKAIVLFETEAADHPIFPEWGHDEAHAWLGQVFLETETPETAKVHFEKALEINPQNNWVKYVLLPNYEKEHAAKNE